MEAELADTNECLSDQTCQNQAIQACNMFTLTMCLMICVLKTTNTKLVSHTQGAKMKCEHEMSNMSHDLDEMASEAALSEEKAQRAMIDAARLAGESCSPIDDLE